MFRANSVDPDLTPHSVASDLDQLCWPRSNEWDAGHYLVMLRMTICCVKRNRFMGWRGGGGVGGILAFFLI